MVQNMEIKFILQQLRSHGMFNYIIIIHILLINYVNVRGILLNYL